LGLGQDHLSLSSNGAWNLLFTGAGLGLLLLRFFLGALLIIDV